jgi:hypothetical protein
MLLYIHLGQYLGYNYGLQLDGETYKVYKVNVTRFADFTNIISTRTFSLEKLDEAIAHAKEIIEKEVEPLLPY